MAAEEAVSLVRGRLGVVAVGRSEVLWPLGGASDRGVRVPRLWAMGLPYRPGGFEGSQVIPWALGSPQRRFVDTAQW